MSARPSLEADLLAYLEDPGALAPQAYRALSGYIAVALIRAGIGTQEREDVLADVWVQVTGSTHELRHARYPLAYLYTIARNTAVNHIKAKTRTKRARPTDYDGDTPRHDDWTAEGVERGVLVRELAGEVASVHSRRAAVQWAAVARGASVNEAYGSTTGHTYRTHSAVRSTVEWIVQEVRS